MAWATRSSLGMERMPAVPRGSAMWDNALQTNTTIPPAIAAMTRRRMVGLL